METPIRLWQNTFAESDYFVLEDFDSDGFVDILRSERGSGAPLQQEDWPQVDADDPAGQPDGSSCSTDFCLAVYHANTMENSQDLLKSVKTSHGADISFGYMRSYKYPDNAIPHIVQTMKTLKINEWWGFKEDPEPGSIYSYEYSGAVYDAEARDFRGFNKITETNPQLSVKTCPSQIFILVK